MDSTLLERWNETVGEDDHVIVVGDFSLRDSVYLNWYKQILRKLNGSKELILGNHDYLKPFDYVGAGFTMVHTALEHDEFVMVHDPASSCIFRGTKRKKVLHGHIHELYKKQKNCLNVGVDVWDFRPIPLETALEECDLV